MVRIGFAKPNYFKASPKRLESVPLSSSELIYFFMVFRLITTEVIRFLGCPRKFRGCQNELPPRRAVVQIENRERCLPLRAKYERK